MKIPSPMVVQVDNAQAISFHKGTCVASKLRGTFDVRDAWVQELRDRHSLIVVPVASCNNCADLCTKPHTTARFKQLLRLVQGKAVDKMHKDMAMTAVAILGA